MSAGPGVRPARQDRRCQRGRRRLLRGHPQSDRLPPVTMQEGHAVVELMHRIWPKPIGPVESNDRTFVVGPYRTPHVLITGASGFIGSHLIERLSKRGEMVRALVRPSSLGIGFRTIARLPDSVWRPV